MRINNNLMAMNTHRQLGAANAGGAKSMEKLSSGMRINRAGDDAAGLAISEKMRGQIRGLNQASANSQDGISMIQTAEGALNETHAILQRMKELATQSANGTNTESDRGEIQKEMNQLTSEINRIGNTTEFNTQKLLDGGGVDPTKTSATSKLLDIPANLSGGQEGTTVATSTFAMSSLNGKRDEIDGKDITFKLGEKEITLTFNANLSESNETQIGIKGLGVDTDGKASGKAIRDALKAAVAKDDDLKDQYEVTGVDANIVVTAKALAFQKDGTLKGVDYQDGKIEFATTDATINAAVGETAVKGIGTRASATIDFSGKTAEELVGEGIYLDGKKVDFFDSSNGAYKGDADISVDLKGAANSEAIVDKVVKALHDGTSDGSAANGANASKLDNVIVTKGEDNNLVITAKASGIEANSIKLEDNFEKTISNLKGTDKITGEEVASANGLKDGTHTVEVTHNVAKSAVLSHGTDFTSGAITIPTETTRDSGTYKVVGTAATNVKLQKMDSDGVFQDTGETLTGLGDSGEMTFGDIKINATYTAADLKSTSEIIFTVEKQHYSATLTEQDGTKGEAVKINSNDVNVELKAEDGSGSATINVGKIEDSLAIGASTKFTFETASPEVAKEEVVGGTFTSKFQIGANKGQSFDMSISDMRSQALNISGTSEAGNHSAVEGAKFTAVKEVSNGTDSTGTEFALDVSSFETATAAIEVLDNAIQSVSAQRSQLGAFQNRLEHTIKNLDTSAENLQAAEARIRDVDMAKEMMEQTKQNILAQASTAMLAQANASPEAVLQLLR